MELIVKISGFYPQEYCYQCMFCRVNEYAESECMLHGLDQIKYPDYEKPDWCPFNDAKEE